MKQQSIWELQHESGHSDPFFFFGVNGLVIDKRLVIDIPGLAEYMTPTFQGLCQFTVVEGITIVIHVPADLSILSGTCVLENMFYFFIYIIKQIYIYK